MQLLALDLSNNRLQHLDMYTELPTKCASLQILNLSDNQVRVESHCRVVLATAVVSRSRACPGLAHNPMVVNHFWNFQEPR